MAEALRVVNPFDGDENPEPTLPGGPAPLFHLTDSGNAQRLVALNPEDLLYCDRQGSWFVWDGTRFAVDDTQEIVRRAKSTAEWIFYEETKRAEDPDVRAKVATHALRTESAARIASMTKLAESDRRVAVRPDDLDTNPLLFNCKNLTLDCSTGARLPHDRSHRITKRGNVEFDADARCPLWLEFLERVMDGNADKIAYLQRWFGYCLTGLTHEDCLFFAWGTGRNGKSSCISTIRHVLGEYAQAIQAETIMMRDRRENANEIAMLQGARFVHTVEVEDGARMAESLVKQLTGGDEVRARRLYSDSFTFTPEFKLCIAGNHKPIIRGTDLAIWKRIHLVPFGVTISEDEADPDLEKKLRTEASGILNWMLEGCLAWHAGGLQPPAEIRAATAEYREEMDILGDFLAERCYELKAAWVLAAELYRAYQDWCSQTGEKAVSQRRFGLALAERGYVRDREATVSRRSIWRGLGLLVEGQMPASQQSFAEELEEEPPF